jgi:alkyl sulfatase
VLFDNRITQHYAIDNYDSLPRRLHRVTVAGDRPAGITGKQSYPVTGDASHYTPAAWCPAGTTRRAPGAQFNQGKLK